jgi:hypothetical protein
MNIKSISTLTIKRADTVVVPSIGRKLFKHEKYKIKIKIKEKTDVRKEEKRVRQGGIEPPAQPWKGRMLPLHHWHPGRVYNETQGYLTCSLSTLEPWLTCVRVACYHYTIAATVYVRTNNIFHNIFIIFHCYTENNSLLII